MNVMTEVLELVEKDALLKGLEFIHESIKEKTTGVKLSAEELPKFLDDYFHMVKFVVEAQPVTEIEKEIEAEEDLE